MPFDQKELWCPNAVGCTFFGATDDSYMLVLDEPIPEDDNAIVCCAEEAIDLVDDEVQEQDAARAQAQLQHFLRRAQQLKLAGSIREMHDSWVYQIDLYTDPSNSVWADAHGDDTDSSQYIVKLAPSMDAVRDLWFRYSLSSLAHSADWTMHRLLFDGGWRYEDCCKRTAQKAKDRVELLELELWHAFASELNVTVVNLGDICSGSHPVTGKGPKMFESVYSKHNLIPESDSDSDSDSDSE